MALTLARLHSSLKALVSIYSFAIGVCDISPIQPQQVHLALGDGLAGSVTIMWSTREPTRTSTVEYGLFESGRLDMAANGTQNNFTDGGHKQATQLMHTVRLSGLVPAQKYAYHVGDGAAGWSGQFSFIAPRDAATIAGDKLRLLAYGDMGTVNELTLKDLASDVQSHFYDLVLHCGDFAYDFDSDDGENGDEWMRSIEPIAAYVPYMVSAGNHEEHYNFSHYKARFSMPFEGRRTLNHYYSFDMGPAHIIAYNTEAFFFPDNFDTAYMQAMYDWLESDLAAANRNREAVPWIIVHGHRPMYCVVAGTGNHCDGEHEQSRRGIPSTCSGDHECQALRPVVEYPVEDLFFKYGVDLAFFGHVHDYERFWPVYNETVRNGTHISKDVYFEPAATVHVTTGSSGNPEMKLGTTSPPQGACTRDSPWCGFQSGYYPKNNQTADFTYSRITVHNASHLEWEQYSSISHSIIDRFMVVQTNHAFFLDKQDFPISV